MRLARIALLLVSLGSVVLAAEAIVRLAGASLLPAAPQNEEGARRADDDLDWFDLSRRNVRGIYNGVPYETNGAGFRGRAVSPRPDRHTFRIALIGDSIAMGSGVRFEDSYGEVLARKLKPALWPRVEVLNFGVAGLQAANVVDRFELLGPRFHPDLVVYGYTLNDLEGPAYRMRVSRDPPAWPRPPGVWDSHLWAYLSPRIASLREALLPPPGSYLHELDENYFDNPEVTAWLEAQLDRLAGITKQLGVCGVVLIHPRLSTLNALHPFDRHYRSVEEAARGRGFSVVRGYPAFRGERAEDLWVSPHDKHPNAEGHALLATTLADALRSLPTSCWERPR